MFNQKRTPARAACAILACCTALPIAPVSAAALPAYNGFAISARRHKTGEPLNPGIFGTSDVHVGEGLDFLCNIKASARRNPTWSVGLYVQGHPLLVKKSTDPAVTQNGGLFSIRVNNWKPKATGDHTVDCRLTIDGYSPAPRPQDITFQVTPALGAGHISPKHFFAHPRIAHGFTTTPKTKAPLLSAHTKICKTTLTSDVKVRANEFAAPAWRPAADGIQVPHLMLRLKHSSVAGNSVTCTYASMHGDVTLTTNLDCKNAYKESTANTYRCE